MPKPTNFPVYYENYINFVAEDDIMNAFLKQENIINNFFTDVTEERSTYRYAPGKWTIKALLQHVIDAERIFAYRALAFARQDKTHLPGFDENSYADNSHADNRSWQSLLEEFKTVRKSTYQLFKSFTPGDLKQTGYANENQQSVLALGFIILGHAYHHINILETRYLLETPL